MSVWSSAGGAVSQNAATSARTRATHASALAAPQSSKTRSSRSTPNNSRDPPSRGGRAVARYVGDEQAPAAALQREKVVVVAPGAGAGVVPRRQLEARDRRQPGRQQRALDLPDGLQFPIERGQRRPELVAQHQVL